MERGATSALAAQLPRRLRAASEVRRIFNTLPRNSAHLTVSRTSPIRSTVIGTRAKEIDTRLLHPAAYRDFSKMRGNAWTTAQRPCKTATTLTSWLTSGTPIKPTSVKPAQEVLCFGKKQSLARFLWGIGGEEGKLTHAHSVFRSTVRRRMHRRRLHTRDLSGQVGLIYGDWLPLHLRSCTAFTSLTVSWRGGRHQSCGHEYGLQ